MAAQRLPGRVRAPRGDARALPARQRVEHQRNPLGSLSRTTWSLDAAFHHNFPSHLVGKLKPDAEYFEHVLEALDAQAPRVLFIDDNAINVEAAARLGIVTRRVAGVDGAREAFRELGLLS